MSIQANSPPQLESQTHLPSQLVNFSYREISTNTILHSYRGIRWQNMENQVCRAYCTYRRPKHNKHLFDEAIVDKRLNVKQMETIYRWPSSKMTFSQTNEVQNNPLQKFYNCDGVLKTNSQNSWKWTKSALQNESQIALIRTLATT